MRHPREQAARILDLASEVMRGPQPEDWKLRKLWRTLAGIQAEALARGLAGSMGPQVQAGPFKGMQMTNDAMGGAFAPALLGIYESELHPAVEAVVAANYPRVINIGCAHGYYAVGLARRMPETKILAFDIEADRRKSCADMAAANGVADRVTVAGEFRGEDFATYADGRKTLLIVDIEGAEMQLLDPVRYPALAAYDLIVEMHDVFVPGASKTIVERFAPTHGIEIVRNRAPSFYDLTPITGGSPDAYIDPFDHMLLSWEERDGPTPWAILKSKIH